MKTKKILRLALYVVAALVLSQGIPYGKNYSNPTVVREPAWDSPETRDLAKRACFDCHSHETVWPWYARVAPMSWLVAYDVEEGRGELNFSNWQNGARKAERPDKMRREISGGDMPPLQYRLAHPTARLQDDEKRRLSAGLTATASRH